MKKLLVMPAILCFVVCNTHAMQKKIIEQLCTGSLGIGFRDSDGKVRRVKFLHPEPHQLYDGDPDPLNYDPLVPLPQKLSLSMHDPDRIKYLLSINTSIANEPYKGEDEARALFPLERAVKKRNIETIRLLLEAGADPNQEELLHDCLNSDPLFYALTLGDSGIEIIKLLEKHGVDPEKHTYADLNALQYARLYKMNKALQILEPGDPLD